MLRETPLYLRLNPADDVVIACRELETGTNLLQENVVCRERIPAGHKVATRAVPKGEPVRRYAQIIGFATQPIAPGQHVHVHKVQICVQGVRNMIAEKRFQIAMCRLLPVNQYWVPLANNATVTERHRNSADGPVIAAQLQSGVSGKQIQFWYIPTFQVQNVRPDGNLVPIDLTLLAYSPEKPSSTKAPELSNVVDLRLKAAERRRATLQAHVDLSLRAAAFARATTQIIDKLHGINVVGVHLLAPACHSSDAGR